MLSLDENANNEPYEKICKIGEGQNNIFNFLGAYGYVYKARCKRTNQIVALKVIKQEGEDGMGITTLREVAQLKDQDHPNIVKLLNVVRILFKTKIINENELQLVFEYLEYDLKKYIDEKKHEINNDMIKDLTRQLIEGISNILI